ncbi:EAL domain-containing protein [Rhodoferax antarcticus]|uniref:EAL, GGDEF, PAS domain-containing sensory box protein n=1 Tax=Rhodoferax antarcticus ANT.BR TaxID=1111071 RepID=A0A1Q8YH74_9BURK|nr:EAL domain-containing protein [Rhodoferax antarcticus]APW45167.1 diguanylate cyclase [Rhodoferax antarcticus]OLP07418.1 EAL, GGDEF, PAS domain-containing sensory box protein [Rhodoferax antarcticus ANT.BR]
MTQAKPTILAMDDTPVNLLTLGAALKDEFDLQLATSGEMGLRLARQNPPDLILLDIMMPGMDGFETCRQLQADPLLALIPVIFVTALQGHEAETQGLQLGARDYIAKPIQVDTARQRIRNLLEHERLRKQVASQRDLLALNLAERQASDDKLKLAASVFTTAREGITITDTNGSILDVNEAFSRITGYSREEVLGQNPRFLNSGQQSRDFYDAMWREILNKGHWYGEIWNRRKDGQIYAQMLTITTVRHDNGEPSNFVAMFSDITALKEHQAKLDHMAHYDVLTGLPNRVLLADRLSQGMIQAQRRQQLLAVVFVDLDGFKSINDAYGHEVGDQLLMATARNMKSVLRESDTLARIGGDEFVAVLVDLDSTLSGGTLLNRLLETASRAVSLGGRELRISASMGVTYYPQDIDIDADQLLRQADHAMYQAKLAGKNRHQVFDTQQDLGLRSHHESLARVRQAMLANELVLFYQPQVNMRSGRVIGAEALIRWQHPDQGLLQPAAFLPLIEDTPLAIEVGEWVIKTALQQLDQWHSSGLQLPVSVNVGARQLQQNNFVARLEETLARHPDIAPGDLSIEVLETSALEDLAGISSVIAQCKRLGVDFALDDFGTGYSSLTYLKRLPVSLLKMDQSFVRDMLVDPDDLAILEAVIGLARAFRRAVIAEGVETIAHGTRLLEMGCDLAQGYGITRPMPAADVPAWVAQWQPDVAWSA